MKTLLLIFSLGLPVAASAQSIVGKWQLVKQTNCIEDELERGEEEDLVADMKSRSGRTSHVIHFKENNSAEESTKIINSRKNYNSKSLLYKFDGKILYMLDKRSQTIIEGFTVEKLSSDSLIISNTDRACDTKVFVKIK